MSESSETTVRATVSEASVVLPAHLHARPAGALVQAAATFASTVEIAYGDKTVNARSVLAVMSLGASAGATVTLRATGADADDAIKTLTDVLATAE